MATTRTNYFQGQFLKQEEFKDESEYLVSLLRHHNQAMHTWGVVYGMELSTAVDDQGKMVVVQVAPGLAVDSQGRFIYLDATGSVNITNSFAGLASVVVTIEYAEQLGSLYEDGDLAGYTKINEIPKIKLQATLPDDASTELALGAIALGLSGNTVIAAGGINETIRKKSGIQAGELKNLVTKFPIPGVAQTSWPSLRSITEGSISHLELTNSNLETKLDVVVASKLGSTTTPVEKLDINGSLAVSSNLEIGGILTVSGVATANTIQGNVSGATLNVSGNFTSADTAQFGALTVSGATVTIDGDLQHPAPQNKITINVTDPQGFEVQGTDALLHTSELKIKDSFLRINRIAQSEGGLEIYRGGTAPSARLYWNDTESKWKVNRLENTENVLTKKYFQEILVGTIMPFAGNSTPTGWLLCNGASYTKTAYPELNTVLQGVYGGDATHFNVPDMDEIIVRGYDPSQTIDTGDIGATYSINHNHTHGFSFNSSYVSAHFHHGLSSCSSNGYHRHSEGTVQTTSTKFFDEEFGWQPIRYYIKY